MAKNGCSAIPRKTLLAAAERIRDHANKLAAAVRDSGDVTFVPLDRLPIDAAIKNLSERSRLPKLVFQPQIKGDDAATANLHVCAYFHLEKAFTDAGLIVGGNKAGQTREIIHVLAKVESARSAIGKLSPKRFQLISIYSSGKIRFAIDARSGLIPYSNCRMPFQAQTIASKTLRGI